MKSIWLATFLLVVPPALGATAAPSEGTGSGAINSGQGLVGPISTKAAPFSTKAGPLSANWVISQADHVSGVSNALQITNPAKVSYDSLMKDTSEMKELKKKGIKKNSARGQVMVSAAKDRVRRAAKAVMTAKGYCSVWKKITCKTGATVPDITEAVRKKLNG